MRNLSVMEQKQVVGGSYTVKVYDKSTHLEVYRNKNASYATKLWVEATYSSKYYTIVSYSN